MLHFAPLRSTPGPSHHLHHNLLRPPLHHPHLSRANILRHRPQEAAGEWSEFCGGGGGGLADGGVVGVSFEGEFKGWV